ncbi:rCG25685 [Rattus norvegicus]|uniref:RCG25685 n=1 Tax=Rattus norvegicus TaxID=10116 RepID=A6I3D3_RAT|nr:rCG25685 [Rattus norvegicus]
MGSMDSSFGRGNSVALVSSSLLGREYLRMPFMIIGELIL